ncbi:MAG: AAA family ATPase [Pseudopedobacter sp.]|nr:AAA family ATPase [Deinococcales bacterium]
MSEHLALFAQYRLDIQALERMNAKNRDQFYEHALEWNWNEVGEVYFSPPLSLPTPEGGDSELERLIPPPIGADKSFDSLREEMMRFARCQMCLVDLVSISSRGPQLAVVETAGMVDQYGGLITTNPTVPQAVLSEVRGRLDNKLPKNNRFLGYYYAMADSELYAGQADLLYRIEKHSQEVRSLHLFRHSLRFEQTGFRYRCKSLVFFETDPLLSGNNRLEGLMQPETSDLALSLLEGFERRALTPTVESEVFKPLPGAKKLLESLQKAERERIKLLEERKKKELKERERITALERRKKELEERKKIQDVQGEAVGLPPVAFEPLKASAAAEQSFGELLAIDPDLVGAMQTYLEEGHNLLLVGPPGCGKTFLATLLADRMGGRKRIFVRTPEEAAREYRCVTDTELCRPDRCAKYSQCFADGGTNYSFATADARWSSLDVVGGLRAQPGEGLRYGWTHGVVAKAVLAFEKSERESGKPHYLILDEFNRANQDEAFGRLFTLLENTYRSSLPLSTFEENGERDLYIPEGFRIIATMNDQDSRSLFPVGSALMRRFLRVDIGIPVLERPWMDKQSFPRESLEKLYAFVGEAADWSGRGRRSDEDNSAVRMPTPRSYDGKVLDAPLERVRSFYPLGTSFVLDALRLSQRGLPLDRALADRVVPQLSGLSRDQLERLGKTALSLSLPLTQAGLERLWLEGAF